MVQSANTPQCPQCGRPPSPQNPILVCEYCGASLMMAAPPGPPPQFGAPQQPYGGPPIAPFGAGNPYAMPIVVRRRSGAAAAPIVIALVALLAVAGGAAAMMLGRSQSGSVSGDDHPHPGGGGVAVRGGNATGAALLEAKCKEGDAPSCIAIGTMYENGQGEPVDKQKAITYYGKACALGDQSGCMLRDMGGINGTPPNTKRR